MNAKNVLLTVAGCALLAVGAVGAVIPILPTTPFVLLAAACFAGNPRMRAWILRNPFFREHLTNYGQRTGLKARTVAISLGFLWVTLGLSMFAMRKLWAVLLLSAVGVAVTIHILWIARSKKPTKDHCEAT